jgi:hypothetical protein
MSELVAVLLGSNRALSNDAAKFLWQIATTLNQLTPALDAAHVPPRLSRAPSEALSRKLIGPLLRRENNTADAPKAAEDLRASFATMLTAADARLGDSYRLGSTLADMCRLRADADETAFANFQELYRDKGNTVQATLADLASAFPEHSARAVSLSSALWEDWVLDPTLSNQAVRWPNDGVHSALERQGELWRSILAGDKAGKDMLELSDYVRSSRTLARLKFEPLGRWRKIALGVALLLAVLLVGALVYAIINDRTQLKAISAGILSVFAVVGISQARLQRSVALGTAELGQRLWGAELDIAIAQAITVAPGDWRRNLQNVPLPPARGVDPHIARNAKTVHHFATAGDGRRPLRRRLKIRTLLSDKCVYVTKPEQPPTGLGPAQDAQPEARLGPGQDMIVARAGKSVRGSRWRVAGHLSNLPMLKLSPEKLVSGTKPHMLATLHKGDGAEQAHVWTFRHGKVTRLEEVFDYNKARESIGLDPIGDGRDQAE